MESVGGWIATVFITVLIAILAIKGLYYQYRKIKEGHCACSGCCSCQSCPESGKPVCPRSADE